MLQIEIKQFTSILATPFKNILFLESIGPSFAFSCIAVMNITIIRYVFRANDFSIYCGKVESFFLEILSSTLTSETGRNDALYPSLKKLESHLDYQQDMGTLLSQSLIRLIRIM